MQTELIIACGILALGGLGVFIAIPATPSRASMARAEAARREARKRRFEGAAEMLHKGGFEADRMMVSDDGKAAFFTETKSGRVCIIEPGEEGKLQASYRDLRRLTGADLVEIVSVAPDPGLLGRLRGEPAAGTRLVTGAELRLAFDPELDLPAGTVVLRFQPGEIAQARIAASSLRGESTRLIVADAKAEARAKALAEAEARRREEEEAKERRRRELVLEESGRLSKAPARALPRRLG